MIINDKKSIINFWIKKLKKDNNKEEEFIGGTFKYIKEQYAKDIDNFDEIINMKNNSLSNIILFEILDFFFDDKMFLVDRMVNMIKSAGVLVYRNNKNNLEVLMCHFGGPYRENVDIGGWSIPKGEVDRKEKLLDCAKREFFEETNLKITT